MEEQVQESVVSSQESAEPAGSPSIPEPLSPPTKLLTGGKTGPVREDRKGKFGARQLFLARLKREKRIDEFTKVTQQLMRETGQLRHRIFWQAARKCGYTTAARERKLLKDWQELRAKPPDDAELELLKREISMKRKAESEQLDEEQMELEFEQAVRTLPDKAPAADELDWIKAHPAMSRQSRSKDRLTVIKLAAEDVLKPPHGKAPSKGAARALQHWCNHTVEFWKMLLSEQKKQVESGDGKRAAAEEDLSEVERLLAEVMGGRTEQHHAGKLNRGSSQGDGRVQPAAEHPGGAADGGPPPGRNGAA